MYFAAIDMPANCRRGISFFEFEATTKGNCMTVHFIFDFFGEGNIAAADTLKFGVANLVGNDITSYISPIFLYTLFNKFQMQ